MNGKVPQGLAGPRKQTASLVLRQRAEQLVRAGVRRALARHRHVLEDQEWSGILSRAVLDGLAQNGVVLVERVRELPSPAPRPSGRPAGERVVAPPPPRAALAALRGAHRERDKALRAAHQAEVNRLERRLTRLQREASERERQSVRPQHALKVLEARVRELVLGLVREEVLLPPEGDPMGYHQGLEAFRQHLSQAVHDVVQDEGGALLEALERSDRQPGRAAGPEEARERPPVAVTKRTRRTRSLPGQRGAEADRPGASAQPALGAP